MANASQKLKILHVVGSMGMGGVENWLMQVLRRIDRSQLQIDFLVETDEPRLFNPEILAKGSKIIPCLNPKNPIAYAKNFFQAYQTYGPYDVVHSHIHHYSGYVLALAHQVGVPIRIAHSHSNNRPGHITLARQCYLRFSKFLIERYATQGLACSPTAAKALYGSQWEKDSRWQTLTCGLDFSTWPPAFGEEAREELSSPEAQITIGHIGRFVEAKNHRFLLEIADALKRHHARPNIHILLMGDGPLRPEIEAMVHTRGLTDIFTFAGTCKNIPAVLKAQVDCLIFPSSYEGLGLAVVEAQAAGVPCLVSDNIPKEADIIPDLIYRLSLSQSPNIWAEALLEHFQQHKDYGYAEALAQAKGSRFNLDQSIEKLQKIYQGHRLDTLLATTRCLAA